MTRIRFDGRGLAAPLSARYTGLPYVISAYRRAEIDVKWPLRRRSGVDG
jgi:hypothetical protein